MRLYLSSFELGNQPTKLVDLVAPHKRIALILNALDNAETARKRWHDSQVEALIRLGFTVKELDLRDYFDDAPGLKIFLSSVDGVWINGGNAFLLRRAMKQSGFDIAIQDLLRADKIVYAGFSAAVCCAAPTLKGADLVDDPHVVPEKYEREIIWDGLRLIDYNVAVHYRSNHPESADIEKEIQYYKDNKMPYKTLRDGEVLIIDGEKCDRVG